MAPDMLGVRRMNNKPLPDLLVKKVKIEDIKFGGGDENTIAKDWPEKYDPYIIHHNPNLIL